MLCCIRLKQYTESPIFRVSVRNPSCAGFLSSPRFRRICNAERIRKAALLPVCKTAHIRTPLGGCAYANGKRYILHDNTVQAMQTIDLEQAKYPPAGHFILGRVPALESEGGFLPPVPGKEHGFEDGIESVLFVHAFDPCHRLNE